MKNSSDAEDDARLPELSATSSTGEIKESSSPSPSSQYNVFRDSLLRYAGYANEVGESFRYQFPRLVVPSYAVSFTYCAADALTTGFSAYYDTEVARNDDGKIDAKEDKENQQYVRVHDSARAAIDVMVWQSLASVAIPGATINAIVRASRFAVGRASIPYAVVSKWLPTAVGLGSIPVIIHPIDHFVDNVMDNSVRQWWKPQAASEKEQSS